MRLLILSLLGVLGLLSWIWRTRPDRKQVSLHWLADERRQAMTRGWERETVSHTGKWNR
jgi:hypothetical protein